MRRFDKKLNIQNANLLAEQRYLQSKDNIIKEYKSLADVDAETDPQNLRFKLITSYGYQPMALSREYSSEEEKLADLKRVVKNEMKKRGYPEINEDTNIDEISGEIKRAAFDAAINKYNKTADWDVANKSKYDDQAKLAMTHINPEVERDIESFAKRFDLSVSFNKAVGDERNVPYINLYFNKSGELVDNNNFQFMINILPMKYNYSAGYRNQDGTQIRPPQGFDRAIVKLIKDIQSKELSYYSSLNRK